MIKQKKYYKHKVRKQEYKINNLEFQLALPIEEQFYYKEFSSKDAPSTGKLMDTTLLNKLLRVEMRLGERFKINSAYRTRHRNSLVGGSEKSLHMRGKAVDIQALTKERKYRIIQAAILEGIPRIGIHERFIHLDVGNHLKEEPRVWLY